MIKRALARVLVSAVWFAVSMIGEPVSAEEWRTSLAEARPEFSQMPFWFWNDALDDAEIKRQLADFRDHGVYGFVIHARMGLPREIPYMGERWLGHVRTAVEEAARTGMRVCLYDEGMYPSGSAHGQVVRSNPAFAAHGLMMQTKDVTGPAGFPLPQPGEGRLVATVLGRMAGEGKAIEFDSLRPVHSDERVVAVPDGSWQIMSFVSVPSGGRIRGVHEGEEDSEPGAPLAADLLNPEAMRAFLRFAYEPYHALLKDHFGRTIIGMFTDEPGMLGRRHQRGLKPWTDGLAEYFQQRRGYDLRAVLPALFRDVGQRTEAIRADFAATLAERLDETYYRQLSDWCREHNIALTGHPAGATEIHPLRYFQIPGQDVVWRGVVPGKATTLEGHNSALGKCSSSVARHDGRRLNSNEVYGAFGWQLSMEEMKWLADWLMVRGVNLLYPHAFYYSIRDYRVHERPPDVGPHDAWWPHYRLFADYTSRVCGLLTDSRQVCQVAVLGRNHQLPWRAARALYQNQIDFNYLEEWRLIDQARIDERRLLVGEMAYTAVLVDQDGPLAEPAARKLAALERSGGKVLYCRGEPTAEFPVNLPRDLVAEPSAPELRCVHVVKDGVDFYLLVNEGESRIETVLDVPVRGETEWFDAWTGEFNPAAARVAERGARISLHLERRSSLLLCIDTRKPLVEGPVVSSQGAAHSVATVAGPWAVTDAQGQTRGQTLGDWTATPDLADYAGTLVYRTAFELTRKPDGHHVLDLGEVGDFAVVKLNDQDLGVRFWAPYRWDVTEAARDGRNTLSVEVTNSLANRYDPKNRRPSGLIGPVTIEVLP